jgi:nicotinamidase/pyrazinamidase
MSCHYKPYCEHYKIKKLLHKRKTTHKNKHQNELRNDHKNGHLGGDKDLDKDSNKNSNKSTNQKTTNKKSALLIIDVQNDFLPGGSLAVMQHKSDKGAQDCEYMINSINELIKANVFDFYIFTQDAHPPGHVSFASSHEGKSPFDVIHLDNEKGEKYPQVLWPDHCRTDGDKNGIGFSNSMILPFDEKTCVKMYADNVYIKEPITACASAIDHALACSANGEPTEYMKKLKEKSYILWKGQDKHTDSYSAFKDAQQRETGLRKFLMSKGVTDIYVCGLARDFCVWWSAVDATTYVNVDTNEKEFNVHFVLDATLPVPGPSTLPDYDINGKSLHQQMVKELSVKVVHGDLEKNTIAGNNWVRAFLNPYGIISISWENLVDKAIQQKGGSKSIFSKSNMINKSSKNHNKTKVNYNSNCNQEELGNFLCAMFKRK